MNEYSMGSIKAYSILGISYEVVPVCAGALPVAVLVVRPELVPPIHGVSAYHSFAAAGIALVGGGIPAYRQFAISWGNAGNRGRSGKAVNAYLDGDFLHIAIVDGARLSCRHYCVGGLGTSYRRCARDGSVCCKVESCGQVFTGLHGVGRLTTVGTDRQ